MRSLRRRGRSRRGTYLSLGLGELAAAAAFAAVAVTSVLPRWESSTDRLALWSALAPLLVVLVQGGAYWLLARSWVGRGRMPQALAAVYRGFRVADVALLVLGLVGVLVWLPSGAAAVLVVAVWLFGVVEYVNYFVARLAYPVGQWLGAVGQWRTPRLVQDLRDARGPGRA